MEKYITSWFNTPRTKELSPNQTIGLVSREFLKSIQAIGYDIQDAKPFQRRICTAICVLREKALNREKPYLSMLSYYVFDQPSEWSREKEVAWFDYHRCVVFDASFWIDFWETIPEMIWEKDVGNWRLEIQDILIQSVDRDVSILSKKCGFKRTEEEHTNLTDNETCMSE